MDADSELTPSGDPVCWLDRVCEACGALPDGPPAAVCERCGAARAVEPPADDDR